METLLALTVSASLALGCLAIGCGLLMIDSHATRAVKAQKSNDIGHV